MIGGKQQVICVEGLAKSFSAKVVQGGFFARLRGLFSPQLRILKALEEVSFEVGRGEKIAFIGPNGAGKSTTMKILTGVWLPTEGKVEVLGHTPGQEREQLAMKIGVLFGQRSRLWPHLPPDDAFMLFGAMYGLSSKALKERLGELIP